MHSCLHTAASNENYRILEVLLAFGGDIHIKDQRGLSLLHEATVNCQPINSTILLHLGIPIDSKDD